MSWTDRPADLDAPGHLVRGDELETTLDQIASLTGSGWTDYTTTAPSGGQAFTLSAVTTPPTQGNSTYLARYRRASGGDLVHMEFRILIGSTFSTGSGVYRFLVPFNASANAILCTVGSGYIFDAGNVNRVGVLRFEAAGYVNWYNATPAANAIDQSGHGTAWATGDIIAGSITYEPA